MGSPVDEPEFQRWREEGSRAVAAAGREAAAENHNWACFLAEQGAQLAVKGLLHGLGRGPWGHDLEALVEGVEEAGIAVPGDVCDAARELARHYIPARYPDAHPARSPGSRYVAQDAQSALRATERILDFVDVTWQSLAAA